MPAASPRFLSPSELHLPSRSSAAANYLASVLELGPQRLIDSAQLQTFVVEIGDRLVPIVVNDGSESDCYIISPHCHYVKYMKYELEKIKNNVNARALGAAVNVVGKVCAPLGFNRCVSVNNWLFTTNPLLRLQVHEIRALTDFLVEKFPRYPIVWRSVDARRPADAEALKQAGYRLVINRPVHEWAPSRLMAGPSRYRTFVRREIKLLESTPGIVVRRDTVPDHREAEVVAGLYRQIYLEKHAGFNVRYTAEFFRLACATGAMRLVTMSVGGEIKGFFTYFDEEERTVAALVGYDTSLDRNEYPFYRMTFALLMDRAIREDKTLFLSTGAAAFKHKRGSYEWFEHEAVFDGHLSAPRRLPWAIVGKALEMSIQRGLDTSQI
jgi:hypothetical protein